MQEFGCKWYAWCVHQAFLFAMQKDHKNWLKWWCLRNKYKHNLSDRDILCYYEFKKKDLGRLKKELLITINGRPKSKTALLKTTVI